MQLFMKIHLFFCICLSQLAARLTAQIAARLAAAPGQLPGQPPNLFKYIPQMNRSIIFLFLPVLTVQYIKSSDGDL